MPGLFITGTDTGVGKTQICAAIAHLLAKRNICVIPRKPIESGCTYTENGLIPEDALTLKTAANSTQSLNQICPFQFQPAISPERAAIQAGIELSLNDIESACLAGSAANDVILVEAAGGFYSPLAHKIRCADLAVQLNFPVLLVVANRLGCINHTLLSVQAIEHAGLELIAVIINQAANDHNTDMNNLADLQRWLDYPLIPVHNHANSNTPWKTIAGESETLQRFVDATLLPRLIENS
ncbi:MAG TPA: dethiobiotin synthase [Crenotrichaceae bacterium]|nr:dethiobiotin synthase [Crenotrichaceae bacterium]